MTSILSEYPNLRLTQGRKVFEIRPTIKWDKGKALEFLLESLGFGHSDNVLPIYIGDDRTDEDAFKVFYNLTLYLIRRSITLECKKRYHDISLFSYSFYILL